MVKRWDIVTVGNLSRNRYWGESEDRPLRPPLCTSTLIVGEGFRLLVDPPIADAREMQRELDRRTGLKPSDIDIVFVTHEHGDHHAGLAHFPGAEWLAGVEAAAAINAAAGHAKAVRPVQGSIRGAIEVLPTPGHTPSHYSLRFSCDGLWVVVAGDAVMTRDFWAQRRGYFNSADPAQAAQTIAHLAGLADAVVPGHDNWFPAPHAR